MEIILILGIPLLLALISAVVKRSRYFSFLNTAGYFCVFIFSLALITCLFNKNEPIAFFNFFYVDYLSAFFIFTISLISFAASLYSISYIARDVREGIISEKKAMAYYGLFNLFTLAMLFSTMVNNLGLVWVAIEITTLVSAFLVGFYNTKRSIEAAWKYIIICSVGISLALLGTILFYYAASTYGKISSLNWTEIFAVAGKLNPQVLKVAFLFIIIGYGTKAGLAPMHTWLPDAHSQALAPISALLSGVLLETAIYAIVRFAMIVNKSLGVHYSSNLFMLFGILSIIVSAAFILVQKDIKRLLAYSSVEHIGIICLGLGFGSALGIYGALLHIFNHAVTKSLLFFSAGDVVKRYKTSDMHQMRGIIQTMPFTGAILILGAFALAGSPPFSIFISEMAILIAGFSAGHYAASVAFLLFVAVIFGAIIYHFSKVVFGKRQEDIATGKEPLAGKIAFVFLFIFVCVMGLKIPVFLNTLLKSTAGVIRGI